MHEQTTNEKISQFFKNNIYTIIIFIVCVVFVFKDILNIQESGKTILEIISSMVISFVMGTTLSFLMGRKGIIAAQSTPSYQNMLQAYDTEIVKTNPRLDLLQPFCDEKNELRLKAIRTKILARERIKYSDFENKTMQEVCGNDKHMTKCWRKAVRAKITYLTPENLLSELDDSYERGSQEITIAKFERNKTFSNMATKLITSMIFGYFSVTLVFNYGNLLWGAIQVALWLILGVMQYMVNFSFIDNVFKQKMFRKINYLVEFNNTYRKGE